MGEIQFSNQYPAELASSITTGSTTLPLKSGHGANFPAIAQGTDKYFFVTIVNPAGAREIVKIVQRAAGSDTLVVGSSMADQPGGNVSGRAQEGTSALAITYTNPHVIELRLTKGTMEWLSRAVPAGEVILFEKDTAVVGYTLKTDVDDGLVYVTKGSVAGGEAGGAAEAGLTQSGSQAADGSAEEDGEVADFLRNLVRGHGNVTGADNVVSLMARVADAPAMPQETLATIACVRVWSARSLAFERVVAAWYSSWVFAAFDVPCGRTQSSMAMISEVIVSAASSGWSCWAMRPGTMTWFANLVSTR